MGPLVSLGAVAFVLFLLRTVSFAGGVMSPELEAALRAAGPGESVPVIVTCTDGSDLDDIRRLRRRVRRSALVRALRRNADVTQKHLKRLLRQRGVRRLVELWAINGLAISTPPGVIRELAALPGISAVRLDETVKAPRLAFDAPSRSEWHLEAIRAPELWALGHRGAGVVVASLDSGVDLHHPDLGGRWRGGSNSWFDPTGEHDLPFDAIGHGTQTMGLMVGGDAGGTAIGVAPDATWIAAKIFDDDGVATLSGIHLAFQWLLDPDGDPDTDDAPNVVNNSWNLTGTVNQCVSEFAADIALLKAAGIAVAFSASNLGPASFSSVGPANGSGFAVGAVNGSLAIASFSSRGPSACDGGVYPQVVVPGVSVRTADLTFGGLFPDSYASVVGTSFAAPQAAGSMALLRSAFPDAGVADLEEALKLSALDLGLAGADNSYGYGLVDVVAAYQYLESRRPCTCAPTVDITADTWCKKKKKSTNFGSKSEFGADADSPGFSLLEVNVSGSDNELTSAMLHLKVSNSSGASSNSGGRIQPVPCTWDENTATWKSSVAFLGTSTPEQEQGAVAKGQELWFDISRWLVGRGDGDFCFAIVNQSTNGVVYRSTESGSMAPYVTFAADCDCPTGSVSTSTTTTTTMAPTTTTMVAGTTTTTSAPPTTVTVTTIPGTTTTTTLMCRPSLTILKDARTEENDGNRNYGMAPILSADADPEKNALFCVRLDCVGRSNIGLTVKVASPADEGRADSDSGGYIQRLTGDFNESTVTFRTAPGFTGAPGPDQGAVTFGDDVTFTLGALGDGTHCFALRSHSGNGVDFYSREAASGRPALVVLP
jgi:bacillopeptidase F